MVDPKIFECTQTCQPYIKNAGEHYQAILNNCVDLCMNNFGITTEAISSIKKGLEIGLIVLIIVLVIIGLLIGFHKLKEDKDDKFDDEGSNKNTDKQ